MKSKYPLAKEIESVDKSIS